MVPLSLYYYIHHKCVINTAACKEKYIAKKGDKLEWDPS